MCLVGTRQRMPRWAPGLHCRGAQRGGQRGRNRQRRIRPSERMGVRGSSSPRSPSSQSLGAGTRAEWCTVLAARCQKIQFESSGGTPDLWPAPGCLGQSGGWGGDERVCCRAQYSAARSTPAHAGSIQKTDSPSRVTWLQCETRTASSLSLYNASLTRAVSSTEAAIAEKTRRS